MSTLCHRALCRATTQVFQPCRGQGTGRCAHTSQATWTLGVKRTWEPYRLPRVTAVVDRYGLSCVYHVWLCCMSSLSIYTVRHGVALLE